MMAAGAGVRGEGDMRAGGQIEAEEQCLRER